MSLNAAAIRMMADMNIPAHAIAEIAEALEEAGAFRPVRYRARKDDRTPEARGK